MQTTMNVSFSQLSPLTSEDLEDYYHQFLSASYDDDEGYGYRRVSLGGDYLSAMLVKRTPTFIPYFDMQRGEISSREIFLYSQVEFALDAKYGLLEVFGVARNSPKVRSAIRSVLKGNSRLQSIVLAPADVVPKLIKNTSRVDVDRLTVNGFQYQEGIIGRYEMRLAHSELAHDVFRRYEYDVVRALVEVTFPDHGKVALDISSGGRLILRCDEATVTDVVTQLKSILFGHKE